jgi:pimeloyl-ACP methyl ester carboxylesterase
LPNSGHMTFMDQQALFNDSVIGFLHPNLQKRPAPKAAD